MSAESTRSAGPIGLQVIGLQKRFGPVVAVDDVAVAVNDGELLAVVGPSGCGKTTLLRIVAGLEQPDAGRVIIQGRDVSGLPPERRDVGFVFQQFALFPNMSVAANVEYGLKRKRIPRNERLRRVEQMLTMVGLAQLADRRPDQLSAGQQQRVALARALAPRPKTLLLDEPLSALDAAIRVRLREELRETQRKLGITTILVTHDQEEALAIADRVAVMNEGRLEQVGTPWELYDRPSTRFVAGFIGRGNFLAAQVSGDHVIFEGFGRVSRRMVAGGASENGEPLHGLADGQMIALVRPESVLIGSGGPAEDALSAEAAIVDVTFGGERSMVTLALTGDGDGGNGEGGHAAGAGEPGGHRPSPSSRDGRLLAAVVSSEAYRLAQNIGRPVTVSIPLAAVRLLPDR